MTHNGRNVGVRSDRGHNVCSARTGPLNTTLEIYRIKFSIYKPRVFNLELEEVQLFTIKALFSKWTCIGEEGHRTVKRGAQSFEKSVEKKGINFSTLLWIKVTAKRGCFTVWLHIWASHLCVIFLSVKYPGLNYIILSKFSVNLVYII